MYLARNRVKACNKFDLTLHSIKHGVPVNTVLNLP